MILPIFATPGQGQARKSRISKRDSATHSKKKSALAQQLSLPIAPTPAAQKWAIAILPIPPAQAIAPDRYWLACNSWKYPLQFKPDERKRLRALLLQYGWLDWAIDEERDCPRCIEVLHEAIEAMIDRPKSGDRGVQP